MPLKAGEFCKRDFENMQKSARSNSVSPCPICMNSGAFSFKGRDLYYDKHEFFDYGKCTSCGTEYQTPLPSPVKISSFYPDEYEQHSPLGAARPISQSKKAVFRYRYGYRHLSPPRLFYRTCVPLLTLFKHRDGVDFVPSGRALDVGCGNGQYIRTMNMLGWQCEGVEVSAIGVSACRSEGLTVFHGKLEEAAFPRDSFDLVTVRHVIEHVPDPVSLVKEVHRILKTGGRMVIETPNSRALARSWFKSLWFANEVPRHLFLFSPEGLVALADTAGFHPIRKKQFTSPKIILNSLDYLLKNRGKPSRKRSLRRFLVRPYVWLAVFLGRGDMLFTIFEKK